MNRIRNIFTIFKESLHYYCESFGIYRKFFHYFCNYFINLLWYKGDYRYLCLVNRWNLDNFNKTKIVIQVKIKNHSLL